MKKIVLITCALKYEYDAIKKVFTDFEQRDISFKFLLTGAGNYNTLFTLQEYLQKTHVDFIVNIGICGTVTKPQEKYFQVYRIYNLASHRESLVPLYITLGSLESICSSEKVIVCKADIGDGQYVDMESFGTDFMASKFKIPCAIFKLPLDIVGEKSKQINTQDIAKILAHFPYKELIDKLKIFFKTHKTEGENLGKYKEAFSFTHAESEIFKKLYNKFITLDIDFKIFYAKNKSLKKSELLKLMEKTN